MVKTCPKCGQGRVFLVPAFLREVASEADPSQVISIMQCDVRVARDGRVVTLCGGRLELTVGDVAGEPVAAPTGSR